MKNVLVILFLFIVGCATVKTSTTTDKRPAYEKVAEDLIGEDLTYTKNGPETYVLCVKEIPGTTEKPRNSISFVIINMSNNQMVMKQKFTGGTVGWYSDYEIEVFHMPGIIQEGQTNDDYTTIYNITKGTSYPKKGVKLN